MPGTGAGFPVVAKKIKWMRIPPNIFFFCKHFGTGVLIATAFVHLLPTAFQSLNDPCLPNLFTKRYPAMPGVIGLGSLFSLFAIEMYLHTKVGGHDHGGATADRLNDTMRVPAQIPTQLRRQQSTHQGSSLEQDSIDLEKAQIKMHVKHLPHTFKLTEWNSQEQELEYRMEDTFRLSNVPSEMPPWFITFYEEYVRQRDEMYIMMRHALPAPSYTAADADTAEHQVSHSHLDTSDDKDLIDPDSPTAKRMALNITLLEGGILFHSIFVGMTVSITTRGFPVPLIAILFHQTFEGLGLGSRIAAVPWKQAWRPWALVLAFGTTAPFGQFIGLVTRNSYDPSSAFALILVGTFNAISSGLLIYAALVDLLYEDFLSEESDRVLTHKRKVLAFGYVLMGAAGMSIVGAFA
ncbi:Zinc/iron permease [Rhizodiscina lignyota]|uniref:Zinc/iron permease n=1 Tax=Rhizodiscina lignyota TaxID=1504668 RepID=A0A9P4ITE1_9PEZI|nr:Zinc/iron permease [Rhizodiscina lignyota]